MNSRWSTILVSSNVNVQAVLYILTVTARLILFPHVGGMLSVAHRRKSQYLLHLIWALFPPRPRPSAGYVTVCPASRSSVSMVSVSPRPTWLNVKTFDDSLVKSISFRTFSVCVLCFSAPLRLSPSAPLCATGVGFNEWTPLLLDRPSACSCGWNYLLHLAWCPSWCSGTNRRRRKRPKTCLMGTDGQQTACTVTRKTAFY